MSKGVVLYWSGTGNTEQMAEAIAKGLGEQAVPIADFNTDSVKDYGRIAFGCPASGDESLEDMEFEAVFEGLEGALQGKKVALFGSYSWGDGQWMRDWQQRVLQDGALLFEEGLIVADTPDAKALSDCEAFGIRFAAF